jgi:hypothetical protein
MKRSLVCLLVLGVGGCGKDFGPEHAPSQQEMANEAQSEASLSVFQADTINADQFGNLANSIYGVANTSYTGMTLPAPRLYAECAVVTDTRVDFHCTNINGNTNLSGYVSRTVNGASVAWHVDLSMSVSISQSGISESESMHLTGDVTAVNKTQINGGLSLGATVHVSNNGQSVDGNVNAEVAYNHLVYDMTNQCVTTGNIIVSLNIDAHSATASQSVDQAVRYTINGCHSFTVAVAK